MKFPWKLFLQWWFCRITANEGKGRLRRNGEMLFPPPKLYATIEPLIRQKVEPAAATNARAKWILSQDVRKENSIALSASRPRGKLEMS